jgi:hypothetical protein
MLDVLETTTQADQPVDASTLLCQNKDTWCVWTKYGRRPSYYHTERGAAESEAIRLAHKHPGQKFIVMHMTGKFSVPAEGVQE